MGLEIHETYMMCREVFILCYDQKIEVNDVTITDATQMSYRPIGTVIHDAS